MKRSGSSHSTGQTSGKSENIVSYSAEEIEAKLARGESQSRHMSEEEALNARHADPDAPRPYPGWEKTIMVGMPETKAQITLRLDRDMLRWFKEKSKGKGYQTLINAVLRGYYEHEVRKEPQQNV